MKTTTLQRHFRLWTLILLVVPSFLVMAIYTFGQIQIAKEKNLELINQRVQSQKISLNQWLTERMDNVRQISQLEAFRTLDYAKMQSILFLMQRSNNNFSALSYVDKNGIFRIVTLSRGIQHTALVGQLYPRGPVPEKAYISSIMIGRNSQVPIINFSFPVYDYEGNFQGVILGSVKTSMISTLLHENWIGQTGELLLVDNQGMLLTEPRYSKLLIEKGLLTGSAILKMKLTDSALEVIHLGESGTGTWVDHSGDQVLGAYQSMPERGWTIIGRIHEAEVTTPIYHQLLLMAGTTLLIILFFLSLATFLTNYIKRPLDWLIQQSDDIATGHCNIIIPYNPRENIPHELRILCETFSRMNYTINNTVRLLKENEANLEHKVSERTIELSNMNSILEEEIAEHQRTNNALTASRDALLVSESRYKDLFYYMHNGCAYYKVIFNSSGVPIDLEYVHVNNTYEQYAGYPASHLIGKSITEIFPGIAGETFDWLKAYIAVGMSGNPTSFTEFFACQQRWYSISAYSPTKGYVAIISEDVTHYLALKKEVARMDRLNLIGNMAAGLAHEIRNPLTVVKGYLQYFKKKLPTHLHEQFNLVLSELARIETIITVFLSIAKNKPTELIQQDLNEIIKSIAPLLSTDALKRSMNIEFKLSNELPQLLLSEKEIRQLLLNISMNGLAAMSAHGTLTIETKPQGKDVILSISDCGCGIPTDIQQKIFDPFFTTRHEGTGLGLSVCASIAARHNALIEVSSVEHKGTCFTITFRKEKLPIKQNPPNFLFETW